MFHGRINFDSRSRPAQPRFGGDRKADGMVTEMQYLHTVYEERSFSRAARRLCVSQSAISAMVSRVEERLGSQLFDRSTIPLTVTPAGMFYMESIEKIFVIENDIDAYFADIRQLRSGTLTIGSSASYFACFLSGMVRRFSEKYPGVEVKLYEGETLDVFEKLMRGQIDMDFGVPHLNQEDDELIFIPFSTEHLLLGVPSSFPINERFTRYQIRPLQGGTALDTAGVEPVPLHVFQNYPFITLSHTTDLCKRTAAICRNAGFEPKLEAQWRQTLTAYYVAAAGAGVIILGDSLARLFPSHTDMIFYRLGDPLAKRTIYYTFKKGRYIT